MKLDSAMIAKRKRQRRRARANRRRRAKEKTKQEQNVIEEQRQIKKDKIKQLKQERNTVESTDKAFASAILTIAKVCPGLTRHSHMEWDGNTFVPTTPTPPPMINVTATMMPVAHRKLGIKWTGSRKGLYKPRLVPSLADSGCQTSTAGTDFLEKIGCPVSYLIPTSHQIVGITSSSLNLLGAVMIRFEYGGKVARQMVHISSKTKGLYLSPEVRSTNIAREW